MKFPRRTALVLPVAAVVAPAVAVAEPQARPHPQAELVWYPPADWAMPELPKRLTREKLAKLFAEKDGLELPDLPGEWATTVKRIWVSPSTAATLTDEFPGVFDPEYQYALLRIGYAGMLWGAHVHTNESIPKGEALLVTNQEAAAPRDDIELCDTACPAPRPIDWEAVVGVRWPG